MVERNPTAEIITANERALRSLERAIALSSGQFSVILVCCNYTVLRELMLQQLAQKGWGHDKIYKVIVPPNALSLYTPIHSQLAQQPAALMVLGLESVEGLDDLLSSINHVRDEFRKRHPFPMIIWVNDEILQKILRLAPDFASWAATPIRFDMTANFLLEFLHQETNYLFARVLHYDTVQSQQITSYYSTLEQVWIRSHELHFAIKELQERGINIEPELNASLEFVFGLDDYVSDRINDALEHFQCSWQFWQQFENVAEPRNLGEEWQNWDIVYFSLPPTSPSSSPPSPHLLKQGILLLYVGLSYCRLAEQNQTAHHQHWQAARKYFKQCLQTFQTANRIDLVSEYIGQLIEVLQCLQAWDELQAVAENALQIHQNYGNHIQLACDYGFLAHAATQKLHWMQASILAHVALLKLGEAQKSGENYNHLFPLLLAQIYYLTLAKAQQKLEETKVAQEYLEKAKQELNAALETSEHQYDAHRYIRYLRILRSLYFEAGCYLEAYIIRQKRRSVEQQYGFRAFIGAGRLQPQRQATNPALLSTSANSSIALEIIVSGREGDINNLIGRISRADQKLTVIHGPSGVGKSSTVSAGLVPALQNRAIGDQIAVPVVLQVYTNWVKELTKALTEALSQISLPKFNQTDPSVHLFPPITIEGILQQLRINADNDLITVLVFDQFEEFFFGHTDREQKQAFDQFICDCLNIPFVKVILSLREDYLHRLLDFKQLSALETVNNNILDKNIRYKLNNFSPDYAKALIKKLTERSPTTSISPSATLGVTSSQLHLEPALIDALVEDLSAELGEVRPIELQVVGAQLQDERITTLAQYQPYRPNKLIERYIKELIKDCGPENERIALLVLYLLTDESNKRPFKTRTELAAELAELEENNQEENAKLEFILDILVRSGLVVLFPDVPERYQLIHDYLVDLIRYLQQQESSLQAQLNQLRHEVEGSQKEIERLKSELRQSKQQVTFVDTTRQQGVDLLTELRELRKRAEFSQLEIEQLRAELKEKELTTQLAKSREQQRRSEAKLNRTLKIALAVSVAAIFGLTISVINVITSEIKTLSTSSEALFASQKDLDALKESLKAGRKLQTTIWVDASTKQQVLTSLYQSIYGIKELNRLEGHLSGVNSVAFSPDHKLIVSASGDNTIYLWQKDGTFIKPLRGHEDAVNSVRFSPSSKLIVSASQDKTVKVWNLQGKILADFKEHKSEVNSASFSPDEQIIASASTDGKVKLWQKDGKFLKDLIGHGKPVLDVAWSPDGKVIASASIDNTVKLWNREGKLLQTLSGHKDAVKTVAWSPDGKTIASGSLDQTIKLWSREGKLLETLSGHSNFVTGVAFSPDSKIIASSSADETVKVWSVQDALLETYRGHNNWINGVSFSPDGKTIASASRDKTVKLWYWNNNLLLHGVNEENGITSISYSPDSRMVVTGHKDYSIRIWDQEGKLLKKIPAHEDQVWGVAWSPDGQYIASASRDATIKLWNKDGQLLNTIKGHKKTVLAVAWSPDSKLLASAGKDNTVKLWNREGRLLKVLKGHTDAVNWVSFSHDGQFLASASDDTTVKIWTRDGSNRYTLTGHTRPIYGVTWSPNDQTIASVSIDSTVKLWNRDGGLQKSLSGDGDGFLGVSWSPDGKTFATNSNEKVKLWSQDGTLLMALKGDQEGKLTSVSFSPDGRTLAIGSDQSYIILRKIADIELKTLLHNGCRLIKDYLDHNSKITSSDRSLCADQSK